MATNDQRIRALERRVADLEEMAKGWFILMPVMQAWSADYVARLRAEGRPVPEWIQEASIRAKAQLDLINQRLGGDRR